MFNRPNWRETRLRVTWPAGLIYLAPLACFLWCGTWWKVLSVIPIGIGIRYSPGFLRRFFGAILCGVILSDYAAASRVIDWTPVHDWAGIFWVWSAGTRFHADGYQHALGQMPKVWWWR